VTKLRYCLAACGATSREREPKVDDAAPCPPAYRRSRTPPRRGLSPSGIARARAKFLRRFPEGFRDDTYLAWERDYKWEAHREWNAQLARTEMETLLAQRRFGDIAARAVKIESGRSLLFSFEKMALRDAVKAPGGAEALARGLYEFLHGAAPVEKRFTRWCEVVAGLPRRQTRVLTWPLVTVFGFIAQPGRHIFLKPNTTREAARRLGFDFHYVSRPNWATYAEYLDLADQTRRTLHDMRPRDMIDIQSFLWVQGSDEYR
jgi:hypothetical protein